MTNKVVNGEIVPLTYAEVVEFQLRDEAWRNSERERKLLDIRSKRDELLIASDYTQLVDDPTGKKDEWAAYRQALRDVTDQADLDHIVWPEVPE